MQKFNSKLLLDLLCDEGVISKDKKINKNLLVINKSLYLVTDKNSFTLWNVGYKKRVENKFITTSLDNKEGNLTVELHRTIDKPSLYRVYKSDIDIENLTDINLCQIVGGESQEGKEGKVTFLTDVELAKIQLITDDASIEGKLDNPSELKLKLELSYNEFTDKRADVALSSIYNLNDQDLEERMRFMVLEMKYWINRCQKN